VHNLESIEIWECFAYINQFRYCKACSFNCDWGAVWVRVDDGEFGEPWARGHKS